MDDDLRKTLGEAIDAQVKGLAERQAINTAKYLNESYAGVRKEMNNEKLIERLKRFAGCYSGEIAPLLREAAAEIERLKREIDLYGNKLLDSATKHSEAIQRNNEAVAEIERLEEKVGQSNSKYVQLASGLKETNDKYNKLIEENNRLDGKNLWLESEVNRLQEQVEKMEKSFPGYETVHIKPEGLFGNSGLRDQFAIAALDGLVSNGIYNPESNARWAYQQADAMLKAREKKNA